MSACPICKKAAPPRADNPAFPFCSPRCKQVDLGQWLKEAYRVPAEEEDSTQDGETGVGAPAPKGKEIS